MDFIVHFFNIKVYTSFGGELVEFLQWNNLRFDLRMKYDWYFKYRAALLQVKYPKYYVESVWGTQPATGRTLEQIKRNRVSAKKAKITEMRNKLKMAVDTWDSLFPIEDDPVFQKAVAKITRLENELYDLMYEPNRH